MEPTPLLELMTQQVARDREEVLARARSRAEAIRAEAEERNAAARTEALAALEQELEAAAQRVRGRAEAAAEMVIKTTKDAVTDDVLTEARTALARMVDDPGFPEVLEALLRELLDEEPLESGTILAPPDHVDRVRGALEAAGRSGLQVEPSRRLRDGVAFQDPGRTYRVTNTLTSRFDRLEPQARKLALTQLFGGER